MIILPAFKKYNDSFTNFFMFVKYFANLKIINVANPTIIWFSLLNPKDSIKSTDFELSLKCLNNG